MYGPRISERERMLHYEHMATLRELVGQGPKSVSEAVQDAQRNVAGGNRLTIPSASATG
jgi:hypothetical protein